MNKAPIGGTASVVNGQWYEGGEFMPEHGLFCGRGKNRIAASQVELVNATSATYRIEWNESRLVFQLIRKSDNYLVCSAAGINSLKKAM